MSLLQKIRELRVGILGGTFNPIHKGHLIMAEASRKEYKLDLVYFIPCGMPPHKKEKLLKAKLRYEMVKQAIKQNKYFKALDIEIKKRKPCYTIDTINELNSHLLTPSSQLYFLIGSDEFEKLKSWRKYKELAKLVTFLILPRLKKKIMLPKIKNLKWKLVHTKPINISSSRVRKKIKAKESVKKLIPRGISNLLFKR